MKKKKKEAALNYSAEVKRLKQEGPDRLYLLWGEEDYLRDSFLKELQNLCFPEGEDSFQHRIFKAEQPDAKELRYAVDTLPFFSEHSLIELWEVDYSRTQDEILPVLEDIPEYCTVAFVLRQDEEVNGKSRLVRFLREHGREIQFTVQDQNALLRWVSRRFAYYGKGIEIEAATRLLYLSGGQMKSLIPEIEKIAAYARGEKVTAADVNAVANRVAESSVFDLTDAISEQRFQYASGILTDLLEQRDSSVPAILSLLSLQFRRLYLAAGARDIRELMTLSGLKYDFLARRLINSARGFGQGQLRHAMLLCAEADYRIKSESTDEKTILKETLMRIILEAEAEKERKRSAGSR
ncbi:MAG: DNA polymerase III subunit delta [Oscillospiraceae bacterium]|nr:DNA polymerase III subunit delta [Oscillospiraceae bacterium]